jgi:hypothetical protein
VTVTIDPGELMPGRREARARAVAAGLGDDDTDRLIKQAQKEVFFAAQKQDLKKSMEIPRSHLLRFTARALHWKCPIPAKTDIGAMTTVPSRTPSRGLRRTRRHFVVVKMSISSDYGISKKV